GPTKLALGPANAPGAASALACTAPVELASPVAPQLSAVHRESNESPRLKAFCRVAPSVLFNDRAIFPAGVFFRASAFNVRTCSDVHARRFPFRLAIISPSGQSAAL